MNKTSLAGLVLFVAASVSAQGTKAPARPDSTKGAATKAATQGKAPAATKTDTKGQATGTKGAPAGTAGGRPAVTVAPPPTPQVQVPPIMRENFSYAPEARRDPFISLLTSAELRPTVADLRLTGILYDESGRNSYATMRDLVTDVQYRVTTGQILGRMRVVLIKRTVVMFSIEEFGLNRQDSLFLGDTTKVRAK